MLRLHCHQHLLNLCSCKSFLTDVFSQSSQSILHWAAGVFSNLNQSRLLLGLKCSRDSHCSQCKTKLCGACKPLPGLAWACLSLLPTSLLPGRVPTQAPGPALVILLPEAFLSSVLGQPYSRDLSSNVSFWERPSLPNMAFPSSVFLL